MSVVSGEVPTTRAERAAVNWLASPLFFWGLLALYLALHVALRLWETPNLGKNDVQEALAAQGWAWGYHPRNPPLHTWLLMASYSVFGVGLLAHVVLKYTLLGATYVFAYLTGRQILTTNGAAVAGAVAVTLLTPFTWTVHTALTHTLLLAAIIFATVWAATRLVKNRRWFDYALFGAVIGLGFLAKYSYPLFLIPFLAAMLFQAEFRRVLVHPRTLVTLAVAVVVFAPHGVWMATAQFDFVEFLAEKQRSEVAQPYLTDIGHGVGNVATGALSFLGPLLLVTALCFRRGLRAEGAPASPWARVLTLAPMLGLGLLLLDVLVLRATQFEERYFMCALLMTPLALFAWLDRRAGALDRKALTGFGVATAAIVLIVAGGLAGRALYYNRTCDRCWDEMAMGDFVHQVRGQSGFHHGTIVADHYSVAGNMRLAFPGSRAVAANYPVEQPLVAANGQCLLAWNARVAGDDLPPALSAYLTRQHITLPAGEPVYVNGRLRRNAERMDRFAYWVLPNADGNCHPRGAAARITLLQRG